MSDEKSIFTEVRKFVTDKIDSGEIIRVDWLTTELMNMRSGINGSDVVFYRVCTRAHLQKIVSQCIGKYETKAKVAQDAELLLPGFEYLQRAYTIFRDEQNVLCPIYKCTDEELLERAKEYDAMAKGCEKHAREIRGFVASRRAAA